MTRHDLVSATCDLVLMVAGIALWCWTVESGTLVGLALAGGR